MRSPKTNTLPLIVLLLSVVLFLTACSKKSDSLDSNGQPDIEQLRAGFLNPPDSARPGVYWYFMDGNLSKEGMTADLESMKQAGIGNVIFLEVNVGVPRGAVDFLGEKWYELFKHAIDGSKKIKNIGENIILDLTGKLSADGTLNWEVPDDGKWTIMRFGRRNNGAITRPAPVQGLGFESDKLNLN